jgi:hypothetical protein
MKNCAQCGAARAGKFCIKCGFKFPEEAPEDNSLLKCSRCGNGIPSGRKFCSKCGEQAPIQKPSTPGPNSVLSQSSPVVRIFSLNLSQLIERLI